MTTSLTGRQALLSALALAVAACSSPAPYQAPRGHLDSNSGGAAIRMQPQLPTPDAPPPPDATTATAAPAESAAPRQPTATREKTFSVSVDDMPLRQLLLVIGRDAGLNLDLHQGIEGRVTLHAIDQTLDELLARIARQAPIRYRIAGRELSVEPDAPFLRSYTIDYVNLSRSMRGQVATSTQIATGSGTGERGSNASVTAIETISTNNFWESILANIRAILDDVPGTRHPCTSGQCESGDILVNRESGLLMVRANARQHELLASFIEQVHNAARRQVMIEATIVEVSLADAYQQGVDWSRLGLPGWNFRSANATGSGAGNANFSFASASTEFRLELLETFGTVKVLSSPRLSVLNNQTAMLKVVEEYVYFLVDATTTEYEDSRREKVTATTTPQSVSVGMVMSVTPQISASGEITLNVRPTISAIAGFRDDPNPSLRNIPNRVPQIRTREIESILRLRSGEIGVLGGLMEDRVEHDTGRLPFLGELPVLGELFTRRNNSVRRTELLIFLRPLLIENPAMDGDFSNYASHLPAQDFLVSAPSPGQRNLPSVPLRPQLQLSPAPLQAQ